MSYQTTTTKSYIIKNKIESIQLEAQKEYYLLMN